MRVKEKSELLADTFKRVCDSLSSVKEYFRFFHFNLDAVDYCQLFENLKVSELENVC